MSASLHSLRTDYIDIFFLHEPTLADLDGNEVLLDSLMKEKQAGKIRAIGIAGRQCAPILSRFGDIIDVVQTAESDWDAASFIPDLTYGAISGGQRAANTSDPKMNPAGKLLLHALSRREQGSVVVGTTRISHLWQLAEFTAYGLTSGCLRTL